MRCRLCVYEFSDKDVTTIFGDEGEPITKLIVKYLDLEISQYDEFTTKICFDCKRHLQEFHEFFEKVEQRQLQLKTLYMEQPEHKADNKSEPNLPNFEHIEEDSIDLKNEEIEIPAPSDAEEFGFTDDKRSTFNNNDAISEPVKLIDGRTKESKNTFAPVYASLSVEKKKWGRPLKLETKKIVANDAEAATVKKSNKEKRNFKKIVLLAEKEKERDDFIAENIELKCEICGDVSSEFKKFRAHFRNEHNQKAYITCCGLLFRHRFRLINHLNFHINPNHYKCKYCDKTLTTQYGYERHVINYHGDKEEKNQECEICKKRFSFKFSLKVHMASHEESKHQCMICKKRFKTLNSLKKHADLHGERKSLVCHVCGNEFKSKQSLENHIKNLHSENASKTKCSICNKWISTGYLKRHEAYHIQEDIECDECGKIFLSRGAMQSHKKGFAHKERVFNCTYCEKSFKVKQLLDEHIAMHTGRKDYYCKFCLREFRCKSNMRKHIRQQHARNYALERAPKNSDI